MYSKQKVSPMGCGTSSLQINGQKIKQASSPKVEQQTPKDDHTPGPTVGSLEKDKERRKEVNVIPKAEPIKEVMVFNMNDNRSKKPKKKKEKSKGMIIEGDSTATEEKQVAELVAFFTEYWIP